MNENLIVSLKDIVVEFDGQKVLDGLSLDIHDKEFVTFLGPSGCGKTTTLRVIAGFVTPKSGNVFFDGKDIANMPPYKRPVNTVFQKYALFPHLNVFENVAFGLRLKKMTEDEIRPKVFEMLEIVGLKALNAAASTSCPAASSSAWPLPAAWSTSPASCCLTSRSARSTSSCARRCSWS